MQKQLEYSLSDKVAAFPIYKAAEAALGFADPRSVQVLVARIGIRTQLMRKEDAAADYRKLLALRGGSSAAPWQVHRDIAPTLLAIDDCAGARQLSNLLLAAVCNLGNLTRLPLLSDEHLSVARCRWSAYEVLAQCHARDGNWGETVRLYSHVRELMKATYAEHQRERLGAGTTVGGSGYLRIGGADTWSAMAAANLVADVLGLQSGATAPTTVWSGAVTDSTLTAAGSSCFSVQAADSADDQTGRWYRPRPGAIARLAAMNLPAIDETHHPAAGVVAHLTAEQLRSEFTVATFQAQFYSMNRPVVAADPELCAWPAATKWTNPQMLDREYGHLKLNTSRLPYPKLHGTKETEITLRQYLLDVLDVVGVVATEQHPKKKQQPGESDTADERLLKTAPHDKLDSRYIFLPIDENHAMRADVVLPLAYFNGGLMMEEKKGMTKKGVFELYLGPALSGAQPHVHGAAWNALLAGKKRWFLWPRVCASHGYGQHFGVSAFKWASTELPKLRGTPCAPIEFEQNAGEVVFVPHGWGHAVLNIEPVIGVAQRIGAPSDLTRAFRHLQG